MRHDAPSQRLPLVIGVTGHRDLRPEDEPALAAAIEAVFVRLAAEYPATPLLLLTPLAEGADQLAARVAQRRSIPYRVPLPMRLDAYREDFAATAGADAFDELLRGAEGAPYELPFFEDNDAFNVREPARRAHQYALLAAHLARTVHVLVAFWDGVASDTIGGTAQAVRFRVLGVPKRYSLVSSVLDAPETGSVLQIYTPRGTSARPNSSAPLAHAVGFRSLRLRREQAGEVEPTPRTLDDVFAQIDELAQDAPIRTRPSIGVSIRSTKTARASRIRSRARRVDPPPKR